MKKPVYLFSVLVAAAAWGLGYVSINKVVPDFTSEHQAVQDAFAIAAGTHHVGIVSYAHFPNGPCYFLVPFIWMGMEEITSFRIITITVSSISIAMFFFALYKQARTSVNKTWAVLFIAALLCQPAFFAWQGILHEFSLEFSAVLVTLAVASSPEWFHPATVWLIGFISGWIGFDFLMAQVSAFFVARWLINNQIRLKSLWGVLRQTIIDAGVLLSGMLYAVAAHWIQNTVFYDSAARAAQDLFGSAALGTRFGDDMEFFNRYHVNSLFGTLNPIKVAWGTFQSFLLGVQSVWPAGLTFEGPNKWTQTPVVIATAVASIGLTVRALAKTFLGNNASRERDILVAIVAFGLTAIGTCAWFLVMTHHASAHLMYLPRHFLVGFCMLGLIPILLEGRPPSGYYALPRKFSTRAKICKFLFLLVPVPILIAALVLAVRS